jgi:hypothetical protein
MPFGSSYERYLESTVMVTVYFPQQGGDGGGEVWKLVPYNNNSHELSKNL